MNNFKFKYYFTNHAPVILSLNEIHIGEALRNLLYKGEAGEVKEICQYTGMNDKKGREIYVKDFVEAYFGVGELKGFIEFDQSCYSVKVTESKTDTYNVGQSIPMFDFINIEIIKEK